MSVGELILGVDPGERAGWAILAGRDVVGVGIVLEATRRARLDAITRVVERAADIADLRGLQRVMRVEAQFVGKNPQSAITIVKYRTEWEVIGFQRGFRVVSVLPSEWHARILPRGRRRTRALVQEQAAKIVRSMFKDADGLTDDEVAAVCLAVTGTMERRI